MPSSCKDIRTALAACLQNSDCVMIERNKPSDCLREPLSQTLPTRCLQLKKGYGECKRGLVDMRKRFRGNQSVAIIEGKEGMATRSGGQLYAGKPAYSDPTPMGAGGKEGGS
ncbi:cytochrome c oxidase assembly protein PET191-domain-containing protein [Trichophaea hybrida]|nr:cytochrome c oxidase assembly protein PET191-domain-containing protein [Trichophaea hybrida]